MTAKGFNQVLFLDLHQMNFYLLLALEPPKTPLKPNYREPIFSKTLLSTLYRWKSIHLMICSPIFLTTGTKQKNIIIL